MAIVVQDHSHFWRLRLTETAGHRETELMRPTTATGIAEVEVKGVSADGSGLNHDRRLSRVRLAEVAHNLQRHPVAALVHSR